MWVYFAYTQGWRLHNLSGHLFQCLTTLKVKKKKIFLTFQWNFPHFCLCLLPLVLPVYTSEKSLAPAVLLPPIRCLYILVFPLSFDKILLYFLFPQLVIISNVDSERATAVKKPKVLADYKIRLPGVIRLSVFGRQVLQSKGKLSGEEIG